MENKELSIINSKLAIIGLGYVGLPLAHAFSSKYKVVGFDIAQWRIDELRNGHDRTLELVCRNSYIPALSLFPAFWIPSLKNFFLLFRNV